MDLFSIASGSSGNCICVGNTSHHVMIDAGVSGKAIERGMNENGMTTSDMEAVLVTHEHFDHIAGLGVIARRYAIPIYATSGTIDAIKKNKSVKNIDQSLFHSIKAGEKFTIGDITVDPVSISHDANDPVAYILSDGQKKVGVLTDLGTYDDNIVEHAKDLNALLLEANHDLNMLECGPYPYNLKMRIMSDRGHLSNEMSGQLLSRLLNDNMEQIFLGHLSKENNYPDIALATVSQEITLSRDNDYKEGDFPIDVAKRNEPMRRVEI
jgi:phosphoribosyl 1,2-cyclic phosphodiesterase